MYIDSHAHITSDSLFPSIKEIIERARLSQVEGIVNICTDLSTLKRGLEVKGRFPEILLTAATTPNDVESDNENFFLEVEKAAAKQQLAAIGETGLDYYYEYSPKNLQKQHLIRYFHLARQVQLPLVFHCREAFEDLFLLAEAEYKLNQPYKEVFISSFRIGTEDYFVEHNERLTPDDIVNLSQVTACLNKNAIAIEQEFKEVLSEIGLKL